MSTDLPSTEPRRDVRYQGVHCAMTIRRPAPGVVVLEIEGNDIGELGAAPFVELARDMEASPSIELFVDARATRLASMEVSSDWAHWLAKNRMKLRHVSMLTGSRFIQITASFVRRFADLGELMRLYTEPAVFDGALTNAIANAGSVAL